VDDIAEQGKELSTGTFAVVGSHTYPEQKRGKEGGGLGAGNWGLWFPPPDGWHAGIEVD
jgi:hypothetical protein